MLHLRFLFQPNSTKECRSKTKLINSTLPDLLGLLRFLLPYCNVTLKKEVIF